MILRTLKPVGGEMRHYFAFFFPEGVLLMPVGDG